MISPFLLDYKKTSDTKTNPVGYVAAEAAKNIFAIWESIISTHQAGSRKTRQHQMFQFLDLK